MKQFLQQAISNTHARSVNKTLEPLTCGNSAKLYCLNLIHDLVTISRQNDTDAGREIVILDLGCGTSRNFIGLLDAVPNIRYIGVEPDRRACVEAERLMQGRNAKIVCQKAYDFRCEPKADIITSFSVLEHVYDRKRYIKCAQQNLADAGVFFINYDAGHFTNPSGVKERVKNLLASVLPLLRRDDLYQSFVTESEFATLVHEAGLLVCDQKAFNSSLKELATTVKEEHLSRFMQDWVSLEVAYNQIGKTYADHLAPLLRTRNFVLVAD